jgi:6-phosphogluconate dehydrogenase
MSPADLAAVFREWNQGELQSYLIEITGNVLAKQDGKSALVDAIEDEAEQKGTGRWTSESALELGVPLTGITEAVFARMLSSQKADRVKAAQILAGPSPSPLAGSEQSPSPLAGEVARSAGGEMQHLSRANSKLVDDVRHALYASKIVAYAQGFEHLRAGSKEFNWNLDLGALATIWRGGCIIRAQFLDRIKDAYAESPDLPNLMLAPFFQQALASAQQSWRTVVKQAIDQGVPIPAFASSLAYYDGYRRARGSANLIQGLRDYFGSHGYHRTDREGAFHTRWAQDGTEVSVD